MAFENRPGNVKPQSWGGPVDGMDGQLTAWMEHQCRSRDIDGASMSLSAAG
jgi:hypothetical protein